jgi:hypothetical protein
MSFTFERDGITYLVKTHVGNGGTVVEVREKDEARECDLEPAEEQAA